jgi:subtilisin-like proprotein convertase family protein
MKWKAQLAALCMAGSALALAGCGDDGGSEIDASTPAPDTGPPPTDAEIPDGPIPTDQPDAAPDASPDAAPDAMLGPETCDNSVDDNGDGKADCEDPKCGEFFPCQAPACQPGENRVFLKATDLPKLIRGGMTTTSTLAVPATVLGAVTNAAVKIAVGHNCVRDLVLKLTNPEGTAIELSSNNGSVGHNYLNTVFADSGTTSVVHGNAPFTGVYKPEQPFTRFHGQAGAGNWKLDVVETFDDPNGDTLDNGGFASFDLMLCVCTTCEVGPSCSDHTDNDGDGMTDCADPDCNGNIRCVPETNCTDHVDNDLDGQIDCQDQQCDGHNNCQFGHEVACGDGIDNDGDAQVDCFDLDCRITPLCREETDCRNGVDDDMDGLPDCRDPGCLATAGFCQVAESNCNDMFDNDGDGLTDCADPTCVNTVICAVPACPAGTMPLTVAATDLPLAIPDSNPTGVTSTINVATTGQVRRVVVTFSATHTFDGDLSISLIAPGATPPGIDLSSTNGLGGDNYIDTIFSDAAGTAITAGMPPYTGPFRPEAPLAPLNNTPLAGAWKLLVKDGAASDLGDITKFEIAFCYAP